MARLLSPAHRSQTQACRLRTALLAWLLFLVPTLAHAQAFDPRAIDELVHNALKVWEVPGVSVVVVRDGRVIYLKGLGVRELGKMDPVTPDTVFALSSCTKGFTALALGMLVDEGKLTWDDPVRKHVPYFQLADPCANEQVTLRDLLCHRTGVGTHDFLWYRAPWDLEEQIRRTGRVPPSRPFRTGLIYQNVMVGAAGVALEKAAGTPWAGFIEKRITRPLGMTATSFTTAAALQAADQARPHRRTRDGRVAPAAWYEFTRPHPALSMNATARDLGKWLRFQLGDGTWNGQRLVSADSLAETHMPQVVIRHEGVARQENPFTHQISYALGWVVQDYRGQQLIQHAGNIDGMRAHLTLVPGAGVGLAILANLQDTRMNLALSNHIVDHLLGFPYKDWDALYGAVLQEQHAQHVRRAREREQHRQMGTKPSLALDDYVGLYENPAYGAARVIKEQDRLVWQWSSWHCPLEHWHLDTFNARSEVLADPELTFTIGADGTVAALRVLDMDFKKRKK